jgi:putative transposase
MIAELRQEHPEASIRMLCQVAEVNRSWFYAHSDSEERDLTLRDAIEGIILVFPGYGFRRVTHALARDGWSINHKRVLRVMRPGINASRVLARREHLELEHLRR